MINSNMREYNYFLYGEPNDYGQVTLSKLPVGKIKMSIHNTSTTTQANILYKDATYLGLTLNQDIDDAYVIQYGSERLKVMYTLQQGRYRQVFMKSFDGRD